ncbi:MAG: pyridoxal phosphate-dependent aminotransferase [Richelia sp. RM2_1_2]|nr:pyridoxal phosphate-dependent aminotransferase [Richelia sp. RM2_1_2]
MLTAKRFLEIGNSPIVEAMHQVAVLKAAGRDIISLAAGEPDFNTPEHIANAGKEAINAGKTKYTCESGLLALRKAICGKFKRDNNLFYTSEQVIASSGGKQIITNALIATLNPSEEAIIPAPYWTSYPNMVRINYGVPVIVKCSAENNFKLTPKQLEAALTNKTKLLFINSPGNPSGAVYTENELAALGEVVTSHPTLVVLADDVYEHTVYDQKFITPAQINSKLYERTITMNSVSKSYSMTGWRIGFAGGPEDIIQTMHKIQAQTTMHPSTISQHAAIAALTGPQTFVHQAQVIFKERRDLVCSLLNMIDGIECAIPQGAFYAYPSVGRLLGKYTPQGKTLQNDRDVMEYFLNEADVATVYGEAFGLSPYLRISYATSTELLTEACRRIDEACKKLK